MKEAKIQYYAIEGSEGTRYVAHVIGEDFISEAYSASPQRTASIISFEPGSFISAFFSEAPPENEIFTKMGVKARKMLETEEDLFLLCLGLK